MGSKKEAEVEEEEEEEEQAVVLLELVDKESKVGSDPRWDVRWINGLAMMDGEGLGKDEIVGGK